MAETELASEEIKEFAGVYMSTRFALCKAELAEFPKGLLVRNGPSDGRNWNDNNKQTQNLQRYIHRAVLRRALQGQLPAEQVKVATTESAPVRLQQPMEGHFHSVSSRYASKID